MRACSGVRVLEVNKGSITEIINLTVEVDAADQLDKGVAR